MSIHIKSIYTKNFRGLQSTQVLDCASLNVFIGKNNSGKSTALAAVQLMFDHLRAGNVVKSWATRRCADEFTNKRSEMPLQIGIEFVCDPVAMKELRDAFRTVAPQMGNAIDELAAVSTTSFVLRQVQFAGAEFQFIESISAGPLQFDGDTLTPSGKVLFSCTPTAGRDLFNQLQSIAESEQTLKGFERAARGDNAFGSFFSQDKPRSSSRFYAERLLSDSAPNARGIRDLSKLLDSASSVEDFRERVSASIASLADDMEKIRSAETSVPMSSYTGDVRSQPDYIIRFMQSHGATAFVHLKERKEPIGRDEAVRLLQLKLRRGGNERLKQVQDTVRSMLGVNLDAFQEGTSAQNAEMDVDEFLAEANGAGVREALRLILDLELGDAKVVLLEEPEVHLHPGLEFAVHSYLQQKSRAAQIFLTTHSTNFVDLVSQQNIYLFKKDASKHTICERVDEGSASAKIPSELGLRLSTVFMFDRLVFVEGPSDESVLRQMASKIGCDIAKAGVAFVHMGGIMNFTHYAAEGTLDILSRRQVKMWFLVDRDERNDKEILGMVSRLGSRAELVVLGRRDIENFLIDASAIRAFLFAKSSGAPTCPSLEEVETAMNSAVDKVRNDVVRLRVEKQLLAPVYLRGKNIAGTIEERIDGAIESLAARKANVASVRSQVDLEVNSSWNLARAIELAPGATFLDETCRNLGYRFNKDSGDSGPLARCLTEAAIPSELKKFLNTVVGV